MNDNSQTTVRALQADEIDQVSGGVLAHLAVVAVMTALAVGIGVVREYASDSGSSGEQATGVRRGTT